MNWTKVGALANIGCLVVALAMLAIQPSIVVLSSPFWKYSPILLLSACVIVSTFITWKAYFTTRSEVQKRAAPDPHTAKALTLGFRLMEEECSDVLRKYRELDQFVRDQVKLPLNTNSWPVLEDGQKWEYHQLELWVLYGRVLWMTKAAELAWKEMGWTDKPVLFQTAKDKLVVMANLIGDLEDFLRVLSEKVSLLESKFSS